MSVNSIDELTENTWKIIQERVETNFKLTKQFATERLKKIGKTRTDLCNPREAAFITDTMGRQGDRLSIHRGTDFLVRG